MAKRSKRSPKPERRFVVRGIQRSEVDLRKLGRALIALAQAEVEKQAAEAHQGDDQPEGKAQHGQPQG
ncbi:hypothetical protein ACWC4E_33860 [Streptomyces sp. NPDC001273]|uniref:hypothetical protein n=1 Tax=unclassified Streptomyces TaxID=2593676 RepID=UPI0033CFA7CB